MVHNHHEIERQRPAVVEDRKTSACSCADAHVFGAVRLILGPDVSSPGPDDGNRKLEDIHVPRGVNRGAACMSQETRSLGIYRNIEIIVGRQSNPLSHLRR